MIGKTVSHYRIVEKLGEGGMGVVYKAQDLTLDRIVALKFIPPTATPTQEEKVRFINEAKVASALDHQNICTFYEIGETPEGNMFIAMAYYEGVTLKERIQQRPLPVDEAVEIAIAVGEGLWKAHQKGIIHRDIKSENIMLTDDGGVKIMDFGLAKILGTTTMTKAGTIVGTVAYMSPEQARGERGDHRSDIWSLGIVFYEIIAGRLPFASAYDEAMIYAILNEEHEPLTSLRSNVPLEFEQIINKALAKSPSLRYQHVEDMLVDLRRLKEGIPKRKKKPAGKRNRLALIVGASIVLLLLAGWGLLAVVFPPSSDIARPESIVQRNVPDSASRGLEQSPTGQNAAAQKESQTGILTKEAKRPEKSEQAPKQAISNTAENTRQPDPKAGIIEALKKDGIETKKRIAVLPLDNFSVDKDDEFFADGLTEELIATISKVGGLRVIARTSVMQYKKQKKTVAEIGRELNVSSVLEGSVRKTSNKFRITVQMVDVKSQEQLWSESYDRELKDLFEIQSDVAQQIAKVLSVQLLSEEMHSLQKQPTDDLDAYTLYLKGRYLWNQRSPGKLFESLEVFNKAIAKDPRYALAYAGLADSYTLLGNFYILPQQEAYPKAKDAASKALALDDGLAEAHNALGFAKMHYDWDWKGAEAEFRRAIALNPSNAVAHSWLAYFLSVMGRFNESLPLIQTAEALDPLSPTIRLDIAVSYYFSRNFDDAIEQLQKILKLDPTFFLANIPLAGCYVQKGKYDEAARVLRKAKNLSGNHPIPTAALAYVDAISGRKAEARKTLEQLRTMGPKSAVSPYWLGVVSLGLGDASQAIEWLKQGYDKKDVSMIFLQTDPILDPLRDDPQFVQLLKSMQFR